MGSRNNVLKRKNIKYLEKLPQYVVHIVLTIMVFIFSIMINNFFTVNNVQNILSSLSIYGVASIGMAYVMICGETDLSVGSIMAFSSVIFADMMANNSLIFSAIISMIAGCLIGAINGFLISKMKIPSFIATLGTSITIKGVALYYTNGQPLPIYNEKSFNLGNASIVGFPIIFLIFLVILIISAIVLKYTTFGRELYAVGSDSMMAGNAGINVRKYKFWVFLIMGLLASFSGILMACRISAGNSLYGTDLTMSAISVNVIGGTSTVGGTGNVWKTFLGLLVLYILYNALMLLGIQAYVQQLFKGIIIVAVIVSDGLNRVLNEN